MFFRIYLFLFFLAFLAFFLYRNVLVFSMKAGVHPFSILRTGRLNRATIMEILIGIEYVALAVVVVGYVFNMGYMDSLGPVAALDMAWAKWLGVIDSWMLVIFMFPPIFQMGKDFRVGLDEELKPVLITDGLFGLTRNPIFFGILHMFLCVFLIAPNCMSLFLVFAYYITVTEQIKEEERFLAPIHGEDYHRYLESVPRFWPRLWPGNKTGKGRAPQ